MTTTLYLPVYKIYSKFQAHSIVANRLVVDIYTYIIRKQEPLKYRKALLLGDY